MKANLIFIHLCMVLSLLALWGYLETANSYLILLAVLSFYGSLCFAFIRLGKLLRK